MARSGIQVYGIKEDLKTLNKLAPDLRRDITKSYRALMQPIIADARNNIPAQPPLSGFGRKWRTIFPWDKARANSGITVKIDTRRARKKNLEKGAQYETLSAFIVQQKNPAGIVYDIAGRGGKSSSSQKRNGVSYDWNNTLIENLNTSKRASRTMWPAAEKNTDNIEAAIKSITEEVERKLSEALSRSNI
jgi:hypothetical protein